MTSLESRHQIFWVWWWQGLLKILHAGGGKWKLLLITISDGERTGLSANPDTGKVKNNKTGKVFGLFMIRGIADNQALIGRLGNISQRDWIVLSVYKGKKVSLVDSRNKSLRSS